MTMSVRMSSSYCSFLLIRHAAAPSKPTLKSLYALVAPIRDTMWWGEIPNTQILVHWQIVLIESRKRLETFLYGLKILKEILYDQQNQTSCSHFAGIMQTQLESELDWLLPWGGSSPQQSRVVATGLETSSQEILNCTKTEHRSLVW